MVVLGDGERFARAGSAISALDQSAIDSGERHVTVDDLVASPLSLTWTQELLEPPADCQARRQEFGRAPKPTA
jgi:hypothetical protein